MVAEAFIALNFLELKQHIGGNDFWKWVLDQTKHSKVKVKTKKCLAQTRNRSD